MRIALDGTRTTTPVLQTPFDERDAVVSPDGRWLAYGADTSGRLEVYVRPFPDTSAGQWQISTSGGRAPLWSRDGKELYFFAIDGALMAVTADAAGTAWNGGQPVALLEPGYDVGTATSGRAYDLSPDGTRFLMLRLPGGLGVVPNVIVVQHFNEELKRLAPAK